MEKSISQHRIHPGWHIAALLVPWIFYAVVLQKYTLTDFAKPWTLSGDGMKNLFCFVEYIRNGSGLYISGLNYPYGEFISFTDNIPIFAVLFKWINDHIVSLLGYEHMIFYALVFVQWVVAAYVLFLVFVRLKVFPLFSILSALGILLLSPQFHRMSPHPSLSFIILIALFFLFSIHIFLDRKSKKNSVYLFLLVFFSTFVHIYFLFLFLVFGGFILLISLIKKEHKIFLFFSIPLFLGAAGAYSTIKFLDAGKDRATKSTGLGIYNSNFEGTFYPNYGRMHSIIKKLSRTQYEPDGEKKNYLGVHNVLFGLVSLVLFVINLFRKNKKKLFISKRVMLYIFWPAIWCWIYSLGIVNDLQRSVFPDLQTPLDQFRVLARLSWMTYVALSIVTMTWFYHKVQAMLLSGKIVLAYGLTVLSFGIWSMEGRANMASELKILRKGYDSPVFMKQPRLLDILEKQGMHPSDFQATLSFPLTNIGSEKIKGEAEGEWFMNYPYMCRLHLGLPTIGLALSRTSLRQACNLSQLLADPLIKKERLDDMDPRPILLLDAKQKATRFNQRITQKGIYLGEFEEVRLYSLPLSAFDHKRFDMTGLMHSIDTLKTCGAFYAEHCDDFLFYIAPDTKGSPKPLRQEHIKKGDAAFDISLSNFKHKPIVFSAWYNISKYTEGGPYPLIQILDNKGTELAKYHFAHHSSYDYVHNWRRISYFIDLKKYPTASVLRHRFETKNHPVRNIFLQKAQTDIYYKVADSLMWKNNHWLHIK